MIYRIKKTKYGTFEVVATRLRKPFLVVILAFFAIITFWIPFLGLVFLGLVLGFRYVVSEKVAKSVLLDFYASTKQPILICQNSENDKSVYKRAEYEKLLLIMSQNKLYENGLLEVKEIYLKESNVLEKWQDYMLRCENTYNKMCQNFLENVKHDEIWCKRWLFNQIFDSQ